jgi:hypothetical protein
LIDLLGGDIAWLADAEAVKGFDIFCAGRQPRSVTAVAECDGRFGVVIGAGDVAAIIPLEFKQIFGFVP